MRTALFLEDGVCQIVLTPESAEERRLLGLFQDNKVLKVYRGSFYDCEGGWVRQGAAIDRDEDSLIFVLRKEEEKNERP